MSVGLVSCPHHKASLDENMHTGRLTGMEREVSDTEFEALLSNLSYT